MAKSNKIVLYRNPEKRLTPRVPSEEGLKPDGIVTTKRHAPIIRYNVEPLKETHGMTVEAERFKTS